MKVIRVILHKEGAEASLTLHFKDTGWPVKARWTGRRRAFRLSDGGVVDCMCGFHRLEETVAFQAAQCGATFLIRDLGGELMLEWDRVIGWE